MKNTIDNVNELDSNLAAHKFANEEEQEFNLWLAFKMKSQRKIQ